MKFEKIFFRMGPISIAVIPTSLSFSSDKTKDVLTLYNQNPFPVKFKVFLYKMTSSICHYDVTNSLLVKL